MKYRNIGNYRRKPRGEEGNEGSENLEVSEKYENLIGRKQATKRRHRTAEE